MLHLRTLLFLPSEKQKRMTKEKFDLLSIPCFISVVPKIKMGASRGAKHGESQEQCDHFKAVESLRNAKKKGFSTILERLQCKVLILISIRRLQYEGRKKSAYPWIN